MEHGDRGDSLLEVVISTVIMAIIGVLMISSIAVARPFADKMSVVGQTVQNLNSLAESINLQPYTPCSSVNPEPYLFADPSVGSQKVLPGFAITNSDLAPVMVSTGSNVHPYSAQLTVQNATSAVTWSVEPILPFGLSLDPTTGVISGTTSQPVSASYSFTAQEVANKTTKSLTLTSALVTVLINNGVTWIPCENAEAAKISTVSSDGTNATYSYTGPQMNIGTAVTVWGNSNPSFDGSMLMISDATANTFTVPNSVADAATGGFANVSSEVDVQQVIVSTIVSGSPLHKVITRAAP